MENPAGLRTGDSRARGGFRLPAGTRSVVTVGMFDGVHLGHRAVLDAAVSRAQERGGHAVAITFRPHPLRIVRPEAAPPILTTAAEKKESLAALGLDYAFFMRFTPELAGLSAERFVRELLIDRFQLAELVVGYDHGLGRNRAGDVDTLRRLGRQYGFDVQSVDAVRINGEPVSSTRIRDRLLEGRVGDAQSLLGRPYMVRGRVVRGRGEGRALGFPTANLRVPHERPTRKLLPREGIYAVRARVLDAPSAHAETADHDGVLHLGPRPTFPDAMPSFEAHLFDFHGDLYGADLEVAFHSRIRDIESFESPDALTAAMREDAAAARAALRAS